MGTRPAPWGDRSQVARAGGQSEQQDHDAGGILRIEIVGLRWGTVLMRTARSDPAAAGGKRMRGIKYAARFDRSLGNPPRGSFCESCERPVPWWSNVPIFAYLASRGRCLMCGAPIRARHLGGELALALAALYLYLNFPPGDAIARFVFIALLLISSLVDYDWRLIPNLIPFPGVPVGFVLAALLMPKVGWKDSLIGIAAGG